MEYKDKKRNILLDKIKLSNAGMKSDYPMDKPVVSSKERVEYPSMYLNIKQVPGLSGYEVGDKVTFLAKGVVTSHQKNEREGGSARETFDIEVREIGCKKR